MIKRFKEKQIVNREYKILLEEIERLSKKTTILNLCAQPTEYAWLGVRNAGASLFPECTLEIPQYYSNQVLTDRQLNILGEKIGALPFDQLIFNGFNTYFTRIIEAAKRTNPKLRVGIIHHGFTAELTGNKVMAKIFSFMVEAINNKKIDKIAFAKYGYSEIFNSFFDTKPYHILYTNPIRETDFNYIKRIGVLTGNSFRKNTATQVLAALSLQDYKVAVSNELDVICFDNGHNTEVLGHLQHEQFLNELSRNIVNSHVTFSEASAGQVFTESLALGVPCITSLTHGYLNDSEELQKALVVERFDDPWAIAQKLKEVIKNRDYLARLGYAYSKEMNKKADYLLKQFLEG